MEAKTQKKKIGKKEKKKKNLQLFHICLSERMLTFNFLSIFTNNLAYGSTIGMTKCKAESVRKNRCSKVIKSI